MSFWQQVVAVGVLMFPEAEEIVARCVASEEVVELCRCVIESLKDFDFKF